MEYRIVKRSFGKYETVDTMNCGFVEASERADALQRERKDGEYFPRLASDPDHIPSSGYQSGLDWL